MDELEALVILNNQPGLGPVRIGKLLAKCGSAEAAVRSLPQITGPWEEDLRLIEQHGVTLFSPFDSRYPAALRELPDRPILLYVKGQLQPSDAEAIAMVGTRAKSPYGAEMAEQLSGGLARMGLTVVSGLARGIDTIAHRAAIKEGRTLAVIGSGLANLYPRENEKLAQAIENQGAVISELPMHTPPDRFTFPRRNRLVSGLSKGVVLVEAPLKSGSMITMEWAGKQGRPRFAVPARADMHSFRGNHHLIKTGQAKLVETAGDVGETFGLSAKPLAVKRPNLEPDEADLFENLPDQEFSPDALAIALNRPIHQLNILLMRLTLKGVVKPLPGKLYNKV